MANTTNFNWETPDDTDLVKDGAAAIRTLGNSIDTSFVDLKGGTTGQILSKASNTDLDFTWITNDVGDITAVTAGTGISGGGTSGAVTITNDMATTITASGDIVVGTGNGTYDNLPIGSTGQVLTADTTVSPYKVKWATPAGGANWSLVNSGGTTLTGATTITVSGISSADKIMILIEDASSVNASDYMNIRFNADSGSNYYQYGATYIFDSTYSAGNFGNQTVNAGAQIRLALQGSNAASATSGWVDLSGGNSSGVKVFSSFGFSGSGGGNGQRHWMTGGYYNSASTISSVSIISGSGNFDNGKIYVYTSA